MTFYETVLREVTAFGKIIDLKRNITMKNNGAWGTIYGTAFIGAAIYFVQHSTTFWMGVLGIIKALFWPAMLMYKALEMLKM